MAKDNGYYVYKIPIKKHREYVKKYDAKHKQEKHERYMKFKSQQDMYYNKHKQFNEPIPEKYLKAKDKKYVRKRSKGGIRGIFRGKK